MCTGQKCIYKDILNKTKCLPNNVSVCSYKSLVINTLKHFWPILGQRKTSLVIFYEKGERAFGHNIISNCLI